MKYFVIADAHGFADQLKRALDKAGFDTNNPEHFFISLGDLLDRGRQPREILKFVLNIPKERRVLVRGNHEDLLDQMITRGYYLGHDSHNGTMQTVIDLEPSAIDFYDALYRVSKNKLWLDYESSLVDYAEIGKNIFVHGWIPCKRNIKKIDYSYSYEKDKNWRKGNWEKARWLNGMELWEDGIKIKGKTIYCGHWHTSWGHALIEDKCSEFGKDADFTPFIAKGICALDACTAYSGFVNCVVIDIPEEKK